MRTREFGAKSFTSLQLVRLDHHPAVSATASGKPGQWTFIVVDEHLYTTSIRGKLALSQNEMLCPKSVDLGGLRFRRRLFDIPFHGQMRTSNPFERTLGL